MELVRSYCIFDMGSLVQNMLGVQVVFSDENKNGRSLVPLFQKW